MAALDVPRTFRPLVGGPAARGGDPGPGAQRNRLPAAFASDSDDEEDEQRLANIEELLCVARDFDERHGGRGTSKCFLGRDQPGQRHRRLGHGSDRVTLMTLHASKGLEFPVVFLVAVEEGLLPHERSRDQPEQLEEERRLMFVGVTRAEQELQLSLAEYRDFRGERKVTVPSSFLMELPRGDMLMNAAASHSGPTVEPILEPTNDEPTNDEPTYEEPSYEEPEFRRADVAAIASLPGMHLTTAAEMIDAGHRSPPPSPDQFEHGALVRHPQYGLGQIVALSGSGASRKATVDFPRRRTEKVRAGPESPAADP